MKDVKKLLPYLYEVKIDYSPMVASVDSYGSSMTKNWVHDSTAFWGID